MPNSTYIPALDATINPDVPGDRQKELPKDCPELSDKRLSGTTLATYPVLFPEKEAFYHISVIPKKSGGKRIIEAPVDWLKAAQRKIYEEVLLPNCPVSKRAYGCIRKRNITGCASHHVNKETILKIDIKDCFHSITSNMIRNALIEYNIPAPVVDKLCYLCTNSRGVLPQGAPTSPSLANIVMIKMYKALQNVASRSGLEFSGYLDDLIFSGTNAKRILFAVQRILKTYGFKYSTKKISYMRRKKEVLGLCVAPGKDHTRLPKRLRNKIRGYIHCIERDLNNGKVDMKFFNHVSGLVAFARQAKDQKAEMFAAKMSVLRERIKGTSIEAKRNIESKS